MKTTLIILITLITGIYIGSELQKKEYLKRALNLQEKDVFTNRDIEHILFNEPLN